MSDEDRWRPTGRRTDTERPTRPSTPSDITIDPLAGGIGVFTAIAIPVFVVGYTRPAGPNALIIVLGVTIGLIAGVIATVWLAHRDGRVWRGRRF